MLHIWLFECSFCWSDIVLCCVVLVCDQVGFVEYAQYYEDMLSSGHWSFFLRLHPFCGVVLLLLRIFLLLLLMVVSMFGMQLWVEIVVWCEVFLD